MKKQILMGLGLLAALSFTACSSSKEDVNSNLESLEQSTLKDEATKIMIPTYETLVARANELKAAIEKFKSTPSKETLDAARSAWRNARLPWEQSEAFLFGPTGDNGIDPALDSWPVDVSAMNDVLNGTQSITAESLAVNNDARGFHLVEYLLWGESGNKSYDVFTPRQMEYLLAASEDICNNAKKLVTYWTPYAEKLASAGDPGNVTYPSFDAAFQQLVMGMIDISNEVGNEKIENPLNGKDEDDQHKDNQPHPDLEESRFSHNSKTDYINNIESVANVYEGKLNGKNYKGVSQVVVAIAKEKNNNALLELNNQIIKQIAVAQKAISNIPGTFTDAIKADNAAGRKAVKLAQKEVGLLNELLLKLNGMAFNAAPPTEE
ncbi:imelysin family protein [Falsiporphyromonas endometrii]|uniref:Imelysin family protein n=1 Tax=Falsiporphyromonas endometrii TaxID=1387297 RepID=A0ABV9K8P4_9PORP